MPNQNYRGRHAKHAAPSSRDERVSPASRESQVEQAYGKHVLNEGQSPKGTQSADYRQSPSGASERYGSHTASAAYQGGAGGYQGTGGYQEVFGSYQGYQDGVTPGVAGVSGINPASTSVDYSRDLYQAGGQRNTRKKGRTVLKVVLIVVALLVLLTGAFAFWFTTQLDGALARNSESTANEALVTSDIRQPYYMLLIGSDEREMGQDVAEAAKAVSSSSESGGGYSDVLMLMRIDAKNDLVTMVSVPRDTPYRTADGELVKINEMYLREGAKGSIKAVSEVTGVPISHYAIVHVSSLIEIVDSLGGIEVDVPQTIRTNDTTTGEWITVEEGRQVLDGHQAQVFARARHEYEDGEVQRQSNVRYLVSAIASAALNRPLPEIPGTVIDLAGYVGTDYKTGDLLTLASAFSAGGGKTKYYSTTGPSNGDINPANEQWMCYPNPEGWKALMAKVDAGEDPKGVDYEATEVHSWE